MEQPKQVIEGAAAYAARGCTATPLRMLIPSAGRKVFELFGVRIRDGLTLQIAFCGLRPQGLPARTVLHLPGDNREWYWSGEYQIARDLDAAAHRKYHPLGDACYLMPWTNDQRIDLYDRRQRKRVKVRMFLIDPKTGDATQEVPHDPHTKYPELPGPVEPRFAGLTEVCTEGDRQSCQYYQYDIKLALVAAEQQRRGNLDLAKLDLNHERAQVRELPGLRATLGPFLATWARSGMHILRPHARVMEERRVTPAELLSMMGRETHAAILARARDPETTGLVLFENHDLCSSQCGCRSVLPIGPRWTIKTVADIPPFINDLPSQRQQPEVWCEIPPSLKQ